MPKKRRKVGGSWRVTFQNGKTRYVNAKSSRQAVYKAQKKVGGKPKVYDTKYLG